MDYLINTAEKNSLVVVIDLNICGQDKLFKHSVNS